MRFSQDEETGAWTADPKGEPFTVIRESRGLVTLQSESDPPTYLTIPAALVRPVEVARGVEVQSEE